MGGPGWARGPRTRSKANLEASCFALRPLLRGFAKNVGVKIVSTQSNLAWHLSVPCSSLLNCQGRGGGKAQPRAARALSFAGQRIEFWSNCNLAPS